MPFLYTLAQSYQEHLSLKPDTQKLKGVSGSLVSFILALQESPTLCICPTWEIALQMYSDLSQVVGEEKQLLLLPEERGNLLNQQQEIERIEVLREISQGFNGVVLVSANALVEKFPTLSDLNHKGQIIKLGDILNMSHLVKTLQDKGFEPVNYVATVGEYAKRGGILDLFPFNAKYPIRLEFFGDEIDDIREFEIGTQKSISKLKSVQLLDNPKSLSADIPFLNLIPKETKTFVCNFAEIKSILSQHGNEISKPILKQLNEFPLVHFGSFIGNIEGKTQSLQSKPQPNFDSKITLLKERLAQNKKKGWKTYILCDTRSQELRLRDLLDLEENRTDLVLKLDTLHEGFELPEQKLALYTDHQIFNRYHRPTLHKQKHKQGGFSIRELLNLSAGDFVTHIDYGIGKYAGLHKMEVRGRVQEVVKLFFKDNDVLYVSINALYKLHKYTGKEGHQPKLTKLGTAEWERIKGNAKKKIKDISRELIKLYAQRKNTPAFAFSEDTLWQKEMEASFAYEDTPDQSKSWEDVKKDMEQSIAMDRLVCGDVGFGKTEIAIRAAFKAVQDGKQVAVLVPTTVLAAQHYETFSKRLSQYPIRVEVVSRFRTDTENKRVFEKLKEGKVDILIGTHRLASKKTEIPNLGLLVIDEEQRFGVAVKERLRQLKANVDTLTLTATPIPRTLQFSLLGARDFSVIATPPPNRQPIETQIHSFEKKLIQDAILYETSRGGQVFFVHNRIQSIEEIADIIRSLVPNIRVRTGHAQMNAEELENIMMDFIHGKFEVLVSTNIVESGLDVGNANTMIINQLRGRVGRSDRKAFCYLLTPSINSLTKEAKMRLQAIEEFSELGGGFAIAMRDMDIRGAGNLLGGEQSGFIADVGYEAYQKILEEAVLELREEEFANAETPITPKALSELSIDLDLDAFIPEEYVTDKVERLNMYRNLGEAFTQEKRQAVRLEWEDRFGKFPQALENLFLVMEIKNQGEQLRLQKIQWKNERLFITFPPKQDKYFYENKFHSVLEKINALPYRYVIKDENQKLRIIIQNVENLEKAVSIIQTLCK